MREPAPAEGLAENIQNRRASIYFARECVKHGDSEERI